jgi:hypothetical protein
LCVFLHPTITHAEIEKEIEDLYDKSSDLPIATIIKMAGFVPIAVVPAEGTIVELELQKKSLLKKYFTRTSSVSGTKRKGK